jgi:hypothetical protein
MYNLDYKKEGSIPNVFRPLELEKLSSIFECVIAKYGEKKTTTLYFHCVPNFFRWFSFDCKTAYLMDKYWNVKLDKEYPMIEIEFCNCEVDETIVQALNNKFIALYEKYLSEKGLISPLLNVV